MKTVKTAKELSLAIKGKETYIYVEGDLKNKVLRIKATGVAAWVIAGGSIATAIALYLATPATTVVTAPIGGVGSAIPFTGAATASIAAITILGIPATTVAITIGVVSGGYGAVKLLKDGYTVESKSEKGIILKRK